MYRQGTFVSCMVVMRKKLCVWILIIVALITLSFFIIDNTEKLDSEKMRSELDAYIIRCKEDGTINSLIDYWTNHFEDGKDLNLNALSKENGTIRFGTKTTAPFSCIQNNAWTGLTIELVYNFCKEYGYGLKINDYGTSNEIVVAVRNGKSDVGGSNISITEERKKNVDFSPAYINNRQVFVINKNDVDLFNAIDDFSTKKIGAITGGLIPISVKEALPKAEVLEFNNISDLFIALSQGKVDAVCHDEIVALNALKNFPQLMITDICVYHDDQFALVYPKSGINSGFVSSIKDSFYNSLIKENRWQIFLRGMGNTVLITVCSILFGSVIGFIFYALCRRGKTAKKLIEIMMKIVDGLPAVVFLMVMYYVVFGQYNLSNIIVSIVAFSIIFASSVISMLSNAISAIDIGQYEASYALGYSERKTFYRMILPQSMPLFWLQFKSSAKNQIKATAIVGYIATVDLTKASDMIRSSTYEQFFPLLIAAVLYFALGVLQTRLVDLIRINSAPSLKKTKAYLRNVEIEK